MKKSSDIVKELVQACETILSQPPSQVGERLCSERELAGRLQVERITVQRAFDLLVEKGVLVRRHGSGTYIRKVPTASKKSRTPNIVAGREFSIHDLFAEPALTPVRKRPLKEHRSLKLGFFMRRRWKDVESKGQIVLGMKDRVQQAGHQLEEVFISEEIDETPDGISADDLATLIQSLGFDGYILWSSEMQMVDERLPKSHAPIIYVSDGERVADHRYSPLVRVGLEDGILRALRILKETGYERIGFIDSFGRGFNENKKKLYFGAIASLELKYRNAKFVKYNDADVLEKMRNMFEVGPRPDAVYVADDIYLRKVTRAWEQIRITPGKDVAVITLANRGVPLPAGYNWSRMEFHPFQLGRMVIDSLLLEIQNAGEAICSVEHQAIWQPGNTHLTAKAIG